MPDIAGADGAQTVAPATQGAEDVKSAGGSVLAELEAEEVAGRQDQPPDPWGDAELLKKLESLDFTKAPKAIRDKIEAPFERHWTKRYQENADERRQIQAERERIFNTVLERLNQGGVAEPSQTVQDQIRERIEAGDVTALPDLVKQEIEREVGPIRAQQAFQKAITTAVSLNPLVREREPEIAEMLKGDPLLSRAAMINNYEFAPLVLAGLADRIEKAQLAQQIETLKAGFEAEKRAYAKRAIEELRARGASLPPVTSKAGSGTPDGRADGFKNLREGMLDAFVKAGGVPDPRL